MYGVTAAFQQGTRAWLAGWLTKRPVYQMLYRYRRGGRVWVMHAPVGRGFGHGCFWGRKPGIDGWIVDHRPAAPIAVPLQVEGV